jgi:hypothetical protein
MALNLTGNYQGISQPPDKALTTEALSKQPFRASAGIRTRFSAPAVYFHVNVNTVAISAEF